ncbi:hypothetical protein ABB37_04702 [Leptomonas pyrrhocoris]|uniref:Uncharacterized protein n=1 Tax=Leptomonas pyrrhocoris TaxID=157538 RepID=A0A0M9G1S5_LEPPY|nr:hypothetical protein ABB37_04702 [Leptomonas pyrrhocoris]XP_015658922.1 hypothetical protein ABB37_04702 [Leptomonas pyrrhocoris]KPA80482.1 hypothetical protein ABB37_04702 [Leptomonas pyrrhocoris]KPA80483.1 hypothetical protein ABB37_04702 [Leptomonas pyrrhocoris]|eukprot:XP_015658921.1 hypothetical protein ABB37_04702 [Leptomonas pyrrhocoris]
MAAEVLTGATRLERVTVYVDLAREAEFLPAITDCAARLAPQCVVVTSKDILAAPPLSAAGVATQNQDDACTPSRTATTIGLIRLWQAEEADVHTRDVNNTVLFMNAAELLITDKTAADGAVTYALYRRQMPVLSFASAHLPACSSLQQLLYTGAKGTTAEEWKDTIRQFLTFPAERGVYTVASTVAADAAAVHVVVNAEGYPIQLPHLSHGAHTNSSDDNGAAMLLPPPPTLFAGALAELRCSSSEHLDVLRRRNPILPGVLEAFHRYQNRGVMRAMLQRGYRVEVAPQTEAAGLTWVQKFVALGEPDETMQLAKVVTAASSLAKFESHWLELPLPEKSA